jgi:hypothetical protein
VAVVGFRKPSFAADDQTTQAFGSGSEAQTPNKVFQSKSTDIRRGNTMSKLRFDPVTYQFYFKCCHEDGERAKAAGFGWDPMRRRYYTEDPNVAAGLSRSGDDHVAELLADALGATTAHKRGGGAGWLRRPLLETAVVQFSSNAIH